MEFVVVNSISFEVFRRTARYHSLAPAKNGSQAWVKSVNDTVAIIRVTYIEHTVVLPKDDVGLISLLNYVEPIVPISFMTTGALINPIVPTNEPMEYRLLLRIRIRIPSP